MDEQVLVAELVDEWPGNKASATRSLNAALGATIARSTRFFAYEQGYRSSL